MKQSPNLYSDIFFENIFELYGIINEENILKDVQGNILDSVDFDPDLLIGQNFLELVFWQTDELNIQAIQYALKTAKEKGFAKTSLKFRVKTNQIRFYELNFVVKKNKKNSPIEIFFCAKDETTLNKEVEFYKQRSEHFLYSAESAGVGLWFWELDKNEIFSTPKCNEIFGLSAHDIFKFDYFLSVLHSDDRENVENDIFESQNLNKPYNVEYRVVHSDGNIHWVSANGKTFYNGNNEPVSMMGSVRLITDDKMAAEELEKIYTLEKQSREAAIQANKAKDYFLALVSHELRSPLNSILGWTQILQKKKVDEETFKKALETIEHSTKSQAKLIEDLVDSARVTSGKLKLEMRPINLLEVVKKAVSSQHPTAEAKNIELEFKYDQERIDVFGDFIRMQQIFTNLITNSIKFTDEYGKVGINISTDDEKVSVQIKDNGQGIKEKDLPYIFNAFAQGENETSKDKKGLGLGLSIAKILTNNQAGEISVTSEGVGKGAEFTVTFPTYFEQEEDSQHIEETEPEKPKNNGLPNAETLKNFRILIVEDDDDSRNVLELYLDQIGADVKSAESVHKALQILNKPENKFDIIISDLAMPEEDGYSFITKVRSSSEYNKIPAIALSAFTAQQNKDKAFDAGFNIYHTKPFEPDLLAEQIFELIKNGSQ